MQKIIQQTSLIMAIFIILGLILRLILISTPGFKTDVVTYQAWANRLVVEGPNRFYTPGYFADYFPGYLYILWIMGETFNLLVPHWGIGSIFFEYFIKSITNIFDFLTVIFIFLIIKRHSKHLAIWGALAYLFNPAVIFNSSIWGQTDGIISFFIVLSFYFLIEIKKYWFWIFAISMSLLIKPQSAVVLPIMYFYVFYKQSFQKLLIATIAIPILTIFLSIPFFLSNPFFGLLELSKNSINVYPYSSLYAFNFWSLFGFWKKDDLIFLGITHQSWGTLFFVLILFFILTKLFISYRKNYLNNYLIYYAAALSYFGFFLFMTRMHERYLLPFLALFTIVVFMKKNYLLLGALILITFIHLLNLWFVYFYYQKVFDNPNYNYNFLYETLNQNYVIFSILSLGIFVMMAIPYFKNK